MSANSRVIEIDAATAEVLEREAKARGLSLADFLSDLASQNTDPLPANMEAMHAKSRGPWSPDALAEDARALAEFEQTGEGIPFEEVVAWIESWGTVGELPAPKPRRL
jgi:predicted transcriptional regulator